MAVPELTHPCIQAGDKTEQGLLTYTGNGAFPPQTKHILLCKVTQRNGSAPSPQTRLLECRSPLSPSPTSAEAA